MKKILMMGVFLLIPTNLFSQIFNVTENTISIDAVNANSVHATWLLKADIDGNTCEVVQIVK